MYTLQNNTPLSNTGVNAGEVVRYVRNALSGTSKGANDPGIKNRSIDGFLKDENSWKRTLERRTEQKTCGFFARPDFKYRECGNVELKNKKLVINSLKEIGNIFNTQVQNLKIFHPKIPYRGKEFKNLKIVTKKKITWYRQDFLPVL